MPDKVGWWLEELGLSEYAAAFAENRIDPDVLPTLTNDDLKDIGVVAVGDRRRLLNAIKALSEQDDETTDKTPQELDPPVGPERTREAERRQLTVMFCDLAGSTALSTRLDPEDLQDVIRGYQETVTEIIRKFDGFIAKYMGDGVLAYFGYPQAHEDDAERAARASLAIIDAMPLFNDAIGRAKGVDLAVRVGVATGPVVVGDIIGEGAAEEAAVIGKTPNLAARLQEVADADQVVVAPVTRRLLGVLFEYEDLGRHALKGIAEPVRAWRVVREGNVTSRFEAKHVGGGLPLVGRQEELGLLVRSWEASKEGHGQAVLILGEAGIGKSRLVEALRQRVAGEDYIAVANRCSPFHVNSTLYPVIEHMKSALGWKPEDSGAEKLEKLDAALMGQSLPPEEAVPLFAELLSLPLPEGRYAPLELSAQQKREQTLDALTGWLMEEAERRPVLQLWEDLHWADPTTLELLGHYIEQSPTVSMLNVLTYRPEFTPPWSMHSHMTPITLNRLERLEVEALIRHQAGGKAVPPEVVEHIVGKSDGVPLYVEELTKTVLESDYLHEEADRYTLVGSLDEVAIPATLQDSLMARLDRLPTVREIAQLGAVLGREFAYEMLRLLAPHEEPDLQGVLGQLVENELLYQRGRPPRASYIFKHALIQDAAYQSLLRRTRQQYHHQVARLMEERFPETVEAHPDLLAHHYTEAGLEMPAIRYWRRAGELALKRSANLEAIAHCTKGLDLIESLPETAELAEEELAMQITIGVPLVATKGYGAPEAARHYKRARELCERFEETSQLLPVLYGQWLDSAAHGDYRSARAFGEELLRFAVQEKDPGPTVVGHRTIAWVDLFRGDLAMCQTHVDEGLSLYDPERHRSLAFQYAHDSKVTLLACRACLEWLKGYPERAVAAGDESISHARGLDHPNSLAYALCYGGVAPAAFRRDPSAVAEAARELVELSEKEAFPLRRTVGKVFEGWSLALSGQAKEGIATMRKAIAELEDAGQNYARTLYVGFLADANLAGGMTEPALRALNNAFALVEKSGERWWEAELHRLGGQCVRLTSGDPGEAELRYREALRIARELGTKSLELRAATSLSRLLSERKTRQQALDLLAPVYGWFTEGFETADLKDAKALIDELS